MEKVIDKYLNDLIIHGLNKTVGDVVLEMADPNQAREEEWRIWNPIRSTVTDQEIEAFQSRIGHKLPESYKRFLKHKHFYELYIGELSFCTHPPGIWRTSLSEMIFEGYPREYLFDKGRIPFADWSDWGHLCFDTSAECKDNDYPIVLWDHDQSDEFEYKYQNFESMLFELDRETKDES